MNEIIKGIRWAGSVCKQSSSRIRQGVADLVELVDEWCRRLILSLHIVVIKFGGVKVRGFNCASNYRK